MYAYEYRFCKPRTLLSNFSILIIIIEGLTLKNACEPYHFYLYLRSNCIIFLHAITILSFPKMNNELLGVLKQKLRGNRKSSVKV